MSDATKKPRGGGITCRYDERALRLADLAALERAKRIEAERRADGKLITTRISDRLVIHATADHRVTEEVSRLYGYYPPPNKLQKKPTRKYKDDRR